MWALETGYWATPREVEHGWLGFLVLEGVLARDITLAGSTSTELVGEGDVLQPWVSRREDGLVRYRASWHVLMPVRLAILDDRLGRALAAGRR